MPALPIHCFRHLPRFAAALAAVSLLAVPAGAATGVTLWVESSSIWEDGGARKVTVMGRTFGPEAREIELRIGGTATSGTDYTLSGASDPTLTLPAFGAVGSVSWTLTPTNDSALEGNETVTFHFEGDDELSAATAILTLVDDDAEITVSAEDAAQSVTARQAVAVTTPDDTELPADESAVGANGEALTHALEGPEETASFELTTVAAAPRAETIALDYETPPAGPALIEVSNGRDLTEAGSLTADMPEPPPVAIDDEVAADEGRAVVIDVLGNDSGLDGRIVEVRLVEPPSHGTARIEAGGAVTYVHDGSETAADRFRYRIDTGDGASPAATVAITVAAVNDAPVFDGPYAFPLAENVDGRKQTVVLGRVRADDPEGRPVRYALDAGADPRFVLDAATGELAYTGPGEDAERVDAYTLTARAEDAAGAAALVELTVPIGDVDEPGRMALTPGAPRVGHPVRAQVSDPDGPVAVQGWQWRRSRDGRTWKTIPGAVADHYTPVRADAGQRLAVNVAYEVEGTSALLTAETAGMVIDPAGDRVRRSALAAVGRSVAEEVVETIGARLQTAPTPEEYFIVNGHRAALGPPEAQAPAAGRPRAGDAPGAAQGLLPSMAPAARAPSAFRLGLDDADRWTVWGRESFARFDGRDAGFGFDGRMLSGFVGVDYRRRPEAGFGLALAHNRGDLGIADASGDGARVHLTQLLPYLRWSPKAGLEVWSLAGFGRGRLDMDGQRPVGLRMAAAGLRWNLRSVGAADLAARADAFAVSLRPRDEAPAAARRARLALEGRSHWQVSADESVRPSLDLGLRWDGGDADRGAGLELAGELAYAHARHGLTVEARARRLLVHQAGGFRQWGASLVLRRESGDRRGLRMSLGPRWGEADNPARSLWQGRRPGTVPAAGADASWNPDEITFQGGYCLGRSRDGRVTPFVEAGAGADGRLRLGTRWEWNAEGTRQIEIFGEQRGLGGAGKGQRGLQLRASFEL